MFLVSVILVAHLSLLLADSIVELPNGQIRGREATTIENQPFFAFEGVPFAAPPVGELRFKPPQPAANWDGILEATQIGNMCFQTTNNYDTESEDCLTLNIYTPQLPSDNHSDLLPVMVNIYGGGFVDGSNGFYTGDLFMNHDVILVSFNYRVGIFGFISTEDEIIPGNYGLKDQAFAIQWVYDNIKLFGGDPEQITILGQSAGSASCAYQLLNQNSRDLIKGAILQSGTFLSPWAYQRNARKINFGTAAVLNSTFETSDDSQALLDFLLTVDARTLDSAAEQYRNNLLQTDQLYLEISQGFYWAPVIEVKNSDAFLTRKMYGLLEAGNIIQVPTLVGITSEENLIFNPDPNYFQALLEAYDQNLDTPVPHDMLIGDQDKLVEMGEAIRDMYTGGEPWADNLGIGMRFSSDTSFTRSVMKYADLASKVADIYFYVFSYDGLLGNVDTHYDGAGSVGHGEDALYLFCGTNCDTSSYPEADGLTKQRLVKIWTDFAKYQNPTPGPSELLQNITWPVLSTEGGDFLYVEIGESLEIKNHPRDTYKKWVALYDSLGYSDFDTY